MPGSSSTSLIVLTPEQGALLSAFRERWSAARTGAATSDRAAAEEGARLAYAAAGLEPPATIVWCHGPAELVAAWDRARSTGKGGVNVRGTIVDGARATASAIMMDRLATQARAEIAAGLRSPLADTVGAAVVAAITRRARERLPGLRIRLADLIRELVAGSRLKWPPFGRAGISSYELGWLASHDFVREACGLVRETEPLRGLFLIAKHAGWLVPHADMCWISARHTALNFDARGRLHGTRGPALAYDDGWKYYAWKGIEVPGELIEQPQDITIQRIDDEPDPMVRRCLIEIVTPQRFVALGGANRAERDETGTLWRKTWWTGDAWAAVEVVDGTPGPDGIQKHYFLQVPAEVRSPRAAVAWTYGVSEEQYRGLAVRT